MWIFSTKSSLFLFAKTEFVKFENVLIGRRHNRTILAKKNRLAFHIINLQPSGKTITDNDKKQCFCVVFVYIKKPAPKRWSRPLLNKLLVCPNGKVRDLHSRYTGSNPVASSF